MTNLGSKDGSSMLSFAVLCLLTITVASSYSYDNVIDDGYSVNSLTPNQFYRITPRTNSGKPFGRPTCGDGTDFSFFFSRPTQRKDNKDRILIELMGGGACWDSNTCGKMSSYLTFPEDLDNFIGLSCSEIDAGLQNEGGDKAINMLCAQQIGNTDFTTYNTVVIPYCTQDVHVGSNIIDYANSQGNDQGRRLEDNGGDMTVRHMGAHNIMSTLRWIFRNFPQANHIAITGCSAGGTGVPIVYDLIRKHYNHFGIRKVQINTIADSPVYLTPSYFLENALDNWNPWQILNRVGFNYKKYRHSEEYPTAAWDYILRKGMNRDRWGFVSHTDDPVSLTYYQYMSGNGENGGGRRLDDGDMESQWYSELTSSLETIQSKHKNVDTYWINDEGHCSFGLYYALQQDGFEEWAGNVFEETTVSMAPRPAVGAFFAAVLIGVGLTGVIVCISRKQSRSVALHIDSLTSDKSLEKSGVWKSVVRQSSVVLETADSLLSDKSKDAPKCCGRLKVFFVTQLSKLAQYPVTAGLALIISIYFWTMIITEGFAHPLNNPSLGPSAIGLSRYGINNPSLIVYKRQWFRIMTSNFLCSGVLTYLVTMLYLAYPVRALECTLQSSLQTVWIITLVALGINLMYAWALEGATCSSLALVLGLQTCHLALKRRRDLGVHSGWPISFVILVFFLSFLFPFDSQWILLFSALFFGPVFGWFGFKEMSDKSEESCESPNDENCTDASPSVRYVGEPMKAVTSEADESNTVEEKQEVSQRAKRGTVHREQSSNAYTWQKEILYIYAVWFVLVVLGLGFNGPNKLYMEPFYTSCDLFYSTEVANIASSYTNEGDRRLDEDWDESMCAEFCIPKLASRFVQLGVSKLGIAAARGQCQDVGYSEHVADKTFAYLSYSLDVEIYYASE